PPFGLTGAAFATLAAEMLILVLCAMSLDKWGVRPNVSGLFAPLAASGAMAVSLFLIMQKLPAWALIPIGGAIYLVIFSLTGGLTRTLREAKASE
ncbi:MAG TPA: polysaccharide biosynthesis C-terminal domain-containing protein, partial [Gemmatimonadaceae bacterium]|nr:polysaccharide biosynthesis C-terminal domain-containing protein [Gemmatimonadaceae bacterium]